MFNVGDMVYIACYEDVPQQVVIVAVKEDRYVVKGLFKKPSTEMIIKPDYYIQDKYVPKILVRREPYNNQKNYRSKNKFVDLLDRRVLSTSLERLVWYIQNDTEMNPEYQRGLVWTLSQKQEYIQNLFLDKAVIKPILISNWDFTEGAKRFEILDGKQRMTTIISFLNNEFPIFDNVYFKDLSSSDANWFVNQDAKYEDIKRWDGDHKLTDQEKIELFLEINELGTKVSDEHLEKVKKMIGG